MLTCLTDSELGNRLWKVGRHKLQCWGFTSAERGHTVGDNVAVTGQHVNPDSTAMM